MGGGGEGACPARAALNRLALPPPPSLAPSSLQGALQLKQDFELVRELLQSEESGLSLESRQRVLSLRVFQQVDNATACLLQQPSKASLPRQTWEALQQCCEWTSNQCQWGRVWPERLHPWGDGETCLASL